MSTTGKVEETIANDVFIEPLEQIVVIGTNLQRPKTIPQQMEEDDRATEKPQEKGF